MLKKIALTAFAILGVARIAGADPITLPGDTPLVIDFENIEQVNVNPDLSTCITCPGHGRLRMLGHLGLHPDFDDPDVDRPGSQHGHRRRRRRVVV